MGTTKNARGLLLRESFFNWNENICTRSTKFEDNFFFHSITIGFSICCEYILFLFFLFLIETAGRVIRVTQPNYKLSLHLCSMRAQISLFICASAFYIDFGCTIKLSENNRRICLFFFLINWIIVSDLRIAKKQQKLFWFW